MKASLLASDATWRGEKPPKHWIRAPIIEKSIYDVVLTTSPVAATVCSSTPVET